MAAKPGTAMSSRLATMKFMQRAAATPKASPDTTPDRSAKRQKLSNGTHDASPIPTPGSDAEAIQRVLAKEDQKRQEAIDREAARRGETKWILDIKTPGQSKPPLMRIASTGYATLDNGAPDQHDDDDDIAAPQSGRRRFGVLPAVPTTNPDQDGSDDGEIDEDEESGGSEAKQDPKMYQELGDALRAKRDAKRKKERSKGMKQAADRRGKQTKLNPPTSISSGGGGRGRTNTAATCHRCGKAGHMKTNCPLKRK